MRAVSETGVTVVSGLPRSGTSLMMQMLAAGGHPLLVDETRRADRHNPRGYFEYEPVKRTARDASWLAGAAGRAVKVVSALLAHLPRERRYRVIFVHRRLEEVLASQRAMLGDAAPRRRRLAPAFAAHERRVARWLDAQSGFEALHVDHADLLAAPHLASARVAQFVDASLDPAAMAGAVDRALYRSRAPTLPRVAWTAEVRTRAAG